MSLRKPRKTISCIDKIALKLFSACFLVACAQTGPAQYEDFVISANEQAVIQSKPDYLQSSFITLFEQGKRNQILNLMHIGKLALSKNNLPEAELAFEQALTEIETVYADNEQAIRARSLWYEEGGKDFKGEPYERAMVYYYRGLIFLLKDEYDNARASFLSGLMQDAFAEEEQNRSDFALLLFMTGWASQKMGAEGLAQEAYLELKQFRPDFIPPTAHHNTLVIAETGKSPRKLADGVGHYQLVYRRGKPIKDTSVDMVCAEQRHNLYPMEDIFWQASSRGGRPVDSIIQGKVNFKKTTEVVGSNLSSVATDAIILSSAFNSSSATNTSTAISLIGVASLAMSANTKPRADTRYWDNLPDMVHLMTFNSADINIPDVFEYKNDQGEVVLSKKANIEHQNKNQNVIWSTNE